MTVGAVDLHDLDAVALEVTGEPGAVGTGALDTNSRECAEPLQPMLEVRVALRVDLEGRRVEDFASFIHNGRHVDVLVGVNPAEHAE